MRFRKQAKSSESSRKIKLLDGTEVLFSGDGIEFARSGNAVRFSYCDPARFPYFSLVLLAAREQSLERALHILSLYGGIPEIREAVIVGNENQDLEIVKRLKNVKFIVGKKQDSPIITSVKYALSCVSNFSQFAIISPVSKQHISAEEMKKFIKIVLESKTAFAVPVAGGSRMHPLIVRSTEFPRIRKVRKEQGLKYLSKISFTEIKV